MERILEEILLQVRKVWQRRWWIVPVAWLVAVAGWFWIDTLPDRYEASARIYVNTESVLQPLLRGMTISPNTDQRVRMMTQTLLARPNLEEVVRESELDLGPDSGSDPDDIVTQLSNSIRLSGGNRNNIYSIRYSSRDPQQAQDVVQTLVNMFMEGGIGGGRNDLARSQQFIENQLERYREELEAKEEDIEQFKREHGNLIPGEGGRGYYARLQSVEQQLQQSRLELREARNRMNTYRRQLEGAEPVLLDEEPSTPAGQERIETPELDARLNDLQRNLDELRRRYTDQHPDVESTRRIIAELERERRQERARLAQERSQRASPRQRPSQSVYEQQLSLALAEAEGNVSSLEERVDAYQQRYQQLREEVDRIPRIESEYASLQRAKDVVESNYEQLLQRRETAQMSGQVESQTEAVDFRVIEPPRVPEEPTEPNRPLLASGVLLFGLAGGTGLAFLLAQLRSTVSSRQKLSELTGRPVLGSVSFVETPRFVRRRRVGFIVFITTIMLLVVVYAGVIASYFML